jgi:hypothetical protein
MTSCDMSILFCKRSEMTCLVYLLAPRQHIQSDLPYSRKKGDDDGLFCAFDVAIDKHLLQTSLDNRLNQPTIVTSHSLQPRISRSVSSDRPPGIKT